MFVFTVLMTCRVSSRSFEHAAQDCFHLRDGWLGLGRCDVVLNEWL
jgi:hypothetical protein